MITAILDFLAAPALGALLLLAGVGVLAGMVFITGVAVGAERTRPVVGTAPVRPPFLVFHDGDQADIDTVPLDLHNGRRHQPSGAHVAHLAVVAAAPRPATTAAEIKALFDLPTAADYYDFPGGAR